MKRSTAILVVLTFFAGLFAVSGCQEPAIQSEKITEKQILPTTRPAKAFPAITFEKTVHDFGEVVAGEKLGCEFKFKNTGLATLVVRRAEATCGCTAFKLDKKPRHAPGYPTDYAPGETGTVYVEYLAPAGLEPVTHHIFVPSNDPNNRTIDLTVKSVTVIKVEVTPRVLNLAFDKPNAGCRQLALTSLDGQEFSIKQFTSPENCITADIDPGAIATRFVLKPKIDIEKLKLTPRGPIKIQITHPDVNEVVVSYFTLAEFEAKPRIVTIEDAHPGKIVKEQILLISNYGREPKIESISSKEGHLKVVNRQKLETGLQLDIEITPPPRGKMVVEYDWLYIKMQDGPEVRVPFNIWYFREDRRIRPPRLRKNANG